MINFPKRNNRDQIFRLIAFLIIIISISSLFFYYKERPLEVESRVADQNKINSEKGEVEGTSVEFDPNELTSVCISSDIPAELYEILSESITSTYQLSYEESECAVNISRFPQDINEYDAVWESVLVPVIRFDSNLEEIESADFTQLIRSRSYLSNTIIWSEEDSAYLNERFDVNFVQSFSNYEEIIQKVKEEKNVIAFLPISEVEPFMKILPINSITPLDPNFNIFTYELSDFIWVKYTNRERSLKDQISLGVQNWEKDRTYDPEKFSQIVFTGRSLLGAGSYADKIDDQSLFDPLSQLRGVFNNADMVTYSLDNTLAQDCTQTPNSTFLCGSEKSLNWVKGGTVSLVGESILDYGREQFKYSLEKFNENGVGYFGGGLNRSTAQIGLEKSFKYFDIAINSFSRVTPTRYLATQTISGNLSPDLRNGDGKLLSEFLEDSSSDKLKIVELQLGKETDVYGDPVSLGTTAELYVNLASRKGADIVYLTYQHNPGGITVTDGTVVFWGLGDLMYTSGAINTSGLVVINHFYEDRLIYFELIPVTVGDDLQVKIADVDKKAEILNTVYELSSIQ